VKHNGCEFTSIADSPMTTMPHEYYHIHNNKHPFTSLWAKWAKIIKCISSWFLNLFLDFYAISYCFAVTRDMFCRMWVEDDPCVMVSRKSFELSISLVATMPFWCGLGALQGRTIDFQHPLQEHWLAWKERYGQRGRKQVLCVLAWHIRSHFASNPCMHWIKSWLYSILTIHLFKNLRRPSCIEHLELLQMHPITRLGRQLYIVHLLPTVKTFQPSSSWSDESSDQCELGLLQGDPGRGGWCSASLERPAIFGRPVKLDRMVPIMEGLVDTEVTFNPFLEFAVCLSCIWCFFVSSSGMLVGNTTSILLTPSTASFLPSLLSSISLVNSACWTFPFSTLAPWAILCVAILSCSARFISISKGSAIATIILGLHRAQGIFIGDSLVFEAMFVHLVVLWGGKLQTPRCVSLGRVYVRWPQVWSLNVKWHFLVKSSLFTAADMFAKNYAGSRYIKVSWWG